MIAVRTKARRWSMRRFAGLAYLVPAGTLGGIWYTFLFVAGGARRDYGTMLREYLMDDPDRALFRVLAALPLACLVLSLAYLARPRGRAASAAWCGAGILLAAAAWRSLDASIAAAVTLPLAFSVPGTIWELARRPPAPA
jgi:hypothetical protein